MATGGLSLAQGFMQGYGFMDQLDKRERRMGLAEAAGERAEKSHQWRGEQMEQQRDDWQREDDGRLIQAMQQGAQSGNIDPKIAQEFGQRFDVDWSNYVKPEFGQALEYLEGTVAGSNSMQSPEFNHAFETVFRSEINKGTGEEYQAADGAHRLEQKRLAGVYPGPDGKTLMVDLEVLDRGPNGEEWRKAPVTENRSAMDENVKAIPLEQALDKLAGHKLMYQSVQKSPELQALIQQHAARTGVQLPKRKERHGEPFQHPQLGWVQPGPDGKLQQLDTNTGNKQHGEAYEHPELGWVQPGPDGKLQQLNKDGARGGQDPADVRTAEWMVESGIASSMDEAWNRLSESRTDPTRFVSDFVTQELKAQEAAGVYPDTEGFRSTDELRSQAIEVLKTIRQETRSGGVEQEAPAPDEAPLEGEVIEGGALRHSDGSYSGTIDRSGAPPTIEKVQAAANKAGSRQAPAAAIEHLRQNPSLAPQFEAKYGFLPEGI